MLGSNVPPKIQLPFGNGASPSFIRAIPVPSQTAIQNGAASYTDGFPPWCFQANGYPFGQDFNGILNILSSWARWDAAGGPVGYDSTFSAAVGGYPAGAVISAATLGNFWLNTVDGNATNPDSGGAGWLGFQLATGPASPMHFGLDIGTTNSIICNVLPAVSSYAAGQVFLISVGASNTNTGAVVANFNGVGSTAVVHTDGSPLVPGEYAGSSMLMLAYTGTNMQLLSNYATTPKTLGASATYFVNASTGSDSNNGTSSGTAWATLQKAVNTISKFDLNGFNVTVTVANGTYGRTSLLPVGGSGSINFVGNAGSPQSCLIATSAGQGSALFCSGANGYTFTGFSFQSVGFIAGVDPGSGVYVQAATLTLTNCAFGGCVGNHISSRNSGQVILTGTLLLYGGVTANALADGASLSALGGSTIVSVPTGIAVTISVPINVTYFIEAFANGSTNVTYSVALTGSGNVTGTRYFAGLNGTVNSGGGGASFYPGTVAGLLQTGGQYA